MIPLNKNNYFVSRRLQPELNRNYNWLIYSGISLIILGLVAGVSNMFFYPHFAGVFLLLAGIIIVVHAFKFWQQKIVGLVIHFVLGALYIFVGIINYISVTSVWHILLVIMTITYLVAGLFRVTGAIIEGIAISGWLLTFLVGIIDIIFALFMWHRWHNLNMYTLINLNGVDIFLTGLALFLLGFDILKVRVC